MNSVSAIHISECYIKPKDAVEGSNQVYHLGPMDLLMLSTDYIQKGLFFTKHPDYSTYNLLETLKQSLSLTLVHFYPLAGRLATIVGEDHHESLVFVDCNKGDGIRFIYATLDMSMSDVLSPTDVPDVVKSLFDHDGAVSHDGHSRPLLSVQVTELVDGIFIGCSMNHVLVDGTSYWHFWNTWSEVHRANSELVSGLREPVYDRWFPDGHGPTITIPYTNPDEFLFRFEAPLLRERIFHFSSESIARLKARANKRNNNDSSNNNNDLISSFQALSTLCWRCIVRANRIPDDQTTNCRLAASSRHKMIPQLPQEYFGNFIIALQSTTTVSELLQHSFEWAASLVHQAVVNHSDKLVREHINQWLPTRYIYNLSMFDCNSVLMGSSPRFDMYGNEFGLGKAVSVRSGYANEFPGKVTSYPGYEGGGSIDLEICLRPESMRALETDQEFMDFASKPDQTY